MQEGAERMRAFALQVGHEGAPQLARRCDAQHRGIADAAAGAQRQRALQFHQRPAGEHARHRHRVFESEEQLTVNDGRAIDGAGDGGAGTDVEIDQAERGSHPARAPAQAQSPGVRSCRSRAAPGASRRAGRSLPRVAVHAAPIRCCGQRRGPPPDQRPAVHNEWAPRAASHWRGRADHYEAAMKTARRSADDARAPVDCPVPADAGDRRCCSPLCAARRSPVTTPRHQQCTVLPRDQQATRPGALSRVWRGPIMAGRR